LKKNKILITGGLSKLGFEFVKYNINKGIFYITYSQNSKLRKFNHFLNHKNIKLIKFNFDKENNSRELKKIKKIKGVNILIFMSAYNPGRKKIEKFKKHEILRSFNINFFHHFQILQIIYSKMIKVNKGQIINIASNAALTGGKMIYPYAAMKAAFSNILISLKEDQKFINKNIKIKNYFFKTIKNYKNTAKIIKIV
jgi:short-subunit dehydrogenase